MSLLFGFVRKQRSHQLHCLTVACDALLHVDAVGTRSAGLRREDVVGGRLDAPVALHQRRLAARDASEAQRQQLLQLDELDGLGRVPPRLIQRHEAVLHRYLSTQQAAIKPVIFLHRAQRANQKLALFFLPKTFGSDSTK